ncbi:MAG: RimK family alpha-L-glutamate ligase [Pirellulaceae bacterium]|jgi:RimK family alpha-L-glutamate ligase|nr:RimK family alpha-L-glutamate ligase [Pirellulaceae bacterium]
MHIGILGSLDNPYVMELQRAASANFPGMTTEVLRFADLQVGIGEPAIERTVPLRGVGSSPACKALIVRSMPIGSLEQVIFRMDCLQAWQSRGVAVHNPPRSLEIAIDKWLCLQRMSDAGVAVPATVCCQTRSAAMEAFEILGGDVLVKPLFGGEGRGILRASDKDLAWRMFGTLQQLGQVLYVQQFVEHFGYDIRVLFVGDESYAIRRIAAGGEWRTNIAQGSRAEPHSLSSEQADVALRARDSVGGSLLGVDLLPARDGRLLVLEVNAVPGWRGLAQTLKVDIAKIFLRWVARQR